MQRCATGEISDHIAIQQEVAELDTSDPSLTMSFGKGGGRSCITQTVSRSVSECLDFPITSCYEIKWKNHVDLIRMEHATTSPGPAHVLAANS